MKIKLPLVLQVLLISVAFIGALLAGTIAIARTQPSSLVFMSAAGIWLLLCFAGLMECSIRLMMRNPSSKFTALSERERKARLRSIRIEPMLWLGGALAIFLVANLTMGSHQ